MPGPQKGFRGKPTECPRCHETKIREEFKKPSFRWGESPYHTLCRECQLEDPDECFPPDGPFRVAEREVERRYGISHEVWMRDAESPLNVLHYALMVAEYTRRHPRAPRPKRLKVHPAYTVEAAERLCRERGLVEIIALPTHTTPQEGGEDARDTDGAAA